MSNETFAFIAYHERDANAILDKILHNIPDYLLVSILIGPVLWTLTLFGFAMNFMIVSAELYATSVSTTSILAASFSLALLAKGIYLLSLFLQFSSKLMSFVAFPVNFI